MFSNNVPDKYEKYMGIYGIKRGWVWKDFLWKQTRNYPLSDLEKIYKYGYRAKEFRGSTIEETFKAINALPYGESENRYRVNWFSNHFERGKLIDIGTGLGVFPYQLKTLGWDVSATEENELSKSFLKQLKIPCLDEPEKSFDVVSVIHVLEHIEELDGFFDYIKKFLKDGGQIFIEVPDAIEFVYLPSDNDEFNSCHVWFFTVPGLYNVVARNGFDVTDIHRVYHPTRRLSRIMLRGTLDIGYYPLHAN